MDYIENMIYVNRKEPPLKPLTTRLRELCDDCLKAPANRHSNAPLNLEPYCEGCRLQWEAADEIDYLRDRIEEVQHDRRRND